jgi:thiol-disulfide isomerase/thioredoxin
VDPLLALALVIALAAGALIAGVVGRFRSGRARTARTSERADLAELGVAQPGSAASIVQFSTEYCAKCPGVRRALEAVVQGDEEVVFAEYDLTHRPDVAARHRVLQTPTVVVFDATGIETARFSGAVRTPAVSRVLDELKGARDDALAR